MRKTRSWKHNRKDRKQFVHDGMVLVGDGWYMTPITNTIGYYKRHTDFMFDDLDAELMAD